MKFPFSQRAFPFLVLLMAGTPLSALTAAPWQMYEAIDSWGSPGNGNGQFATGAFGLARDAAGNLFVGDHGNGRVQKFDANGNLITMFGIGMLSYPQGVAVDGLGRVYVADVGNGRVLRFRWDEGTKYVYDLTVASGMIAPVGVATDNTGQTVYASDYTAYRVLKFTWDGSQYVLAARFGRNGGDGSGGDGPGEFSGPAQITLAPSGYLYIADPNNNRVQKLRTDGTFVRAYGSVGSGAGQFIRPHMAVEDAHGDLFVSDTSNHRVQKLDGDGNVLALLGRNGGDSSAGSGAGEFGSPLGLALGLDGRLYVSEVDNNRVQSFGLSTVTLSGTVTSAAKTGLAGVTVSALGLDVQAVSAVDGSFALTVPQGWSGRLQPFLAGQVFTPVKQEANAQVGDVGGLDFAARPVALPGYHTFVRNIASPGVGPGQLNRPWHVALNHAGDLYVADQNNHRVLKFAADGSFVTMWGRNGGDGTPGNGDGEFNAPCGVVVDPVGNVYVADHYNHRVQKFDANGAMLEKWGRNGGDGSAGSGPGEFTQPIGLAVDAAGCIYVGEAGNGRIQKFNAYGTLLHAWASGAGQSVAVDGAGRVYVLTYTENTVRVYDWISEAGTYQQTAAWPVTGNPGGCCVDDAGTLYVAETWAARVRRFAPDGSELGQWGSGGSGDGQFSIPCGVVVDPDGWVYVSDTGNNRIQKFRRTDDPPRTVTFLAAAGGTLTGTTPQVVEQGTGTTPVTAQADPGYHFVQWTAEGESLSTDNPITLPSVTADLTLTAVFAINAYTLTYLAGEHGSITGDTSQTVNHGAGGTAVEAVPNPGYHFVQWSDAVAANPRTDTTVTADLNVTAIFAINAYTLTYLAGEHGSIAGASPQTVNHGADGTAVEAVPDPGYRFVQWSDAVTANPRTDTTVTADLNVTATFAINAHTLTYAPGEHGSITGDTPQTVNHGADGTPVTAVPAYGFTFTQWNDGVTANPRTDTRVAGDVNVTARFEPAPAAPAGGTSVAETDDDAVAAGRGLWDLTGLYPTTVAGAPLTLSLMHDTRGRLTGTASLQVAAPKGLVLVTLPVKGSVQGSAGTLYANLVVRGANTARTVNVALTFALSLDATARQLSGPVTGSIRTGLRSTPVAEIVTLAIPAPMDGTWTLRFDLVPSTREINGSATLSLSNGVAYRYAVKGRLSSTTVTVNLTAESTAAAAKGITIKAVLTTLAGGWARLDALAGTGYGQSIFW